MTKEKVDRGTPDAQSRPAIDWDRRGRLMVVVDGKQVAVRTGSTEDEDRDIEPTTALRLLKVKEVVWIVEAWNGELIDKRMRKLQDEPFTALFTKAHVDESGIWIADARVDEKGKVIENPVDTEGATIQIPRLVAELGAQGISVDIVAAPSGLKDERYPFPGPIDHILYTRRKAGFSFDAGGEFQGELTVHGINGMKKSNLPNFVEARNVWVY